MRLAGVGSGTSFIASCVGLASILGCDPKETSIGAWSPDTGAAFSGIYLEAENGELSQGFTIESDRLASGQRYISPPSGIDSDDVPGEARARYEFLARTAGTFVIWGRIGSPGADRNRFWIQLDGGSWVKWRISVGEIWYWDDFHDDFDYGTPLSFVLSEGAHELVIANCVDGVALDRLYFTAEGDSPPGNDTPCNPPHSIEVGGRCLPSCGSLHGRTCGDVACMGQELLPAYDCDVCCRAEP